MKKVIFCQVLLSIFLFTSHNSFAQLPIENSSKISKNGIVIIHLEESYRGIYHPNGEVVNGELVYTNATKTKSIQDVKYLYVYKDNPNKDERLWVLQPTPHSVGTWKANAFTTGKFPWSNDWNRPTVWASKLNASEPTYCINGLIFNDWHYSEVACYSCKEYNKSELENPGSIPAESHLVKRRLEYNCNECERKNGVFLGNQLKEQFKNFCKKAPISCEQDNGSFFITPYAILEVPVEDIYGEVPEISYFQPIDENYLGGEEGTYHTDFIQNQICISENRKRSIKPEEGCGDLGDQSCIGVVDESTRCPYWAGDSFQFWNCQRIGHKCPNNEIVPSGISCGDPKVCNSEGADLSSAIAASKQMHISFNETNIKKWFSTMTGDPLDLMQDIETSTIGTRMSLSDIPRGNDFLSTARVLAPLLIPHVDPKLKLSLAISGSGVQGRVQKYAGDFDFIAKMVISTTNEEQAHAKLARIVHQMAQKNTENEEYSIRFIEAKFGTNLNGKPVTWNAKDMLQGATIFNNSIQPYWYTNRNHTMVKLDWIFVRKKDGLLLNVSVLIDPIWKRPDGSVQSMDSGIDGFSQEVYLDGSNEHLAYLIELEKLLPDDLRHRYTHAMKVEVNAYAKKGNYGKVARRLYNYKRTHCSLVTAAYLGELFDEDQNQIYQQIGRLKGVDEAYKRTNIDRQLIVNMIATILQDLNTNEALSTADKADFVAWLSTMKQHIQMRRDFNETLNHGYTLARNKFMVRAEQISNIWFKQALLANVNTSYWVNQN